MPILHPYINGGKKPLFTNSILAVFRIVMATVLVILKGITQRLDYLQNLGIDAIWLNPICASPNDDNGYDISDYKAIMKEMGTMADFDEMLAGMKKRNIKLIMDLVINHSSDEHKWFIEAKRSRDNKYCNYYHWWPKEKGTPT